MTALSAAGMLLLFEEGRRRDPLARTALAIAVADGEPAPLRLTAGELSWGYIKNYYRWVPTGSPMRAARR